MSQSWLSLFLNFSCFSCWDKIPNTHESRRKSFSSQCIEVSVNSCLAPMQGSLAENNARRNSSWMSRKEAASSSSGGSGSGHIASVVAAAKPPFPFHVIQATCLLSGTSHTQGVDPIIHTQNDDKLIRGLTQCCIPLIPVLHILEPTTSKKPHL